MKRTYQEMIAWQGVKEVYFRIPSLVYQALIEHIDLRKKKQSISSCYFELAGFEFYQTYLEYFKLVQEGCIPEFGSLKLDNLPEFVSKDDYHRITSKGYYRTPFKSRKCPVIFLDVSDHIHQCLNYTESKSILFRELTLPIVISKLVDRIRPHLIK